ncbi:MAG: alpha/beta hydrolase [Pseudanabaenales cyanobacterium]|nr:alpha/beta hydrolase [Pseudanabaenales cyanobacterium]
MKLMPFLNRCVTRYFPGVLTLTAVSVLSVGGSAIAADEVVFTYGFLGRTVSIEEFEELAETGRATGTLRFLLNVTGEDPEKVREVLTYEVDADVVLVDGVLNTDVGEFFLSELGRVLETHRHVAGVQALRGALVLAASTDNTISLLEFIQKFPTDQLYVNGAELAREVREVNVVLGEINGFIEHLDCGCGTQTAQYSAQ